MTMRTWCRTHSAALTMFGALVTTILAANVTAALVGQIPIGFGLLIPFGTVFAALAFVLRDLIHQAGGWRWVTAAIATGVVVSVGVGLWIGSPIPGVPGWRVAVASGLAFGLSETLDAYVWVRLREWSTRGAMLISNTAGAALDTALFLAVSGFGLTTAGFTGQFLVKAVVVSPIAVAALWLLARQRTVVAP
jgi:uncharacterized PurR-regulated membrane protein YhhQ (DUF165 family)